MNEQKKTIKILTASEARKLTDSVSKLEPALRAIERQAMNGFSNSILVDLTDSDMDVLTEAGYRISRVSRGRVKVEW